MRFWNVVLAVGLVGCSGHATAGDVGEPLDLRQFLPDSLRTATAGAHDSTFRQELRVGPASARVEVRWTSFQHGAGRYLGPITARLTESVPYDSLRLGHPSNLRNSGTKMAPVASARVQVEWFKTTYLRHRSGSTSFDFDASGTRTTGTSAR
jgi:hypothetical protein